MNSSQGLVVQVGPIRVESAAAYPRLVSRPALKNQLFICTVFFSRKHVLSFAPSAGAYRYVRAATAFRAAASASLLALEPLSAERAAAADAETEKGTPPLVPLRHRRPTLSKYDSVSDDDNAPPSFDAQLQWTMTAVGCCLLFYLWLSAAVRPAVPNWLYLAVQQPFSFTTHHHSHHHHHHQALPLSTSLVTRICHSLNYLNDQQKRMCIAHPSTMHSVSIGARQAIAECQWQFRLERWNCTPVRTPNESISDIFATTLKSGSRESAFIEAISTAGLVHSVVSACTAGNVTDCSCDLSRHGMAAFSQGNNPNDVGERWRWGGCSDNIRYGLMFAREFLDRHTRRSWQQNRDARFLVTLHNHEVGRKVISENMRRSCRCHGVSGSCEFKTCWLQMPKLTDIGERLKMYYDRSAIQVTKRPKRKLRRKNRYERKIPIRHSELVFHNRSPNYCVRDERIGTLGTHGRQCNRTSFGTDSCDLLCCGRGYDTRVVLKYERCHCKFVWCCYVTCKTCAWNVEMHTCK